MFFINKLYKNKMLFVIPAIVLIILIAVLFLIRGYTNNDKDVVSVAEAAKVIAEADTQEGTFSLENMEGYWYEPYLSYMQGQDIFKDKNAKDLVTYRDMCEIIIALGADIDTVQREVDFKLSGKRNIKRAEFTKLLTALQNYLDGDGVTVEELTIISEQGTDIITDTGVYSCYGLTNSYGLDTRVEAVVKNEEILMYVRLISGSVEYNNVWIEEASENKVALNIYGTKREYAGVKLSENVSLKLGDIMIKDGCVKSISVKNDVISGKVLSVTKEYVEISGYGEVLLDDFFRIYNFVPDGKAGSLSDIIVGYNLQEFIVAEGKICGVVISEKLIADNIRVIIKTTGFKSLTHETVTLSSDSTLVLSYGNELENIEALEAGEAVTISREDERLKNGRIKITSDGGEISVQSIERAQGVPSYEGDIELMLYDEGIIIVNELNVEDYLKRVVPSEMPSGYGVEALKVQAVCARNYAYRQIENNKYSRYGAHVDDSTSFQVYNNTKESEASNRAIKETVNEVLKYNDVPAMTYYYSTSCGSSNDVSIWGSSAAAMPYMVCKSIGSAEKNIDYSSEENFRQVIKSEDKSDYDYDCAYYRWSICVDKEALNKSFNSRLTDNLDNIQVLDENNVYTDKDIKSIGQIKDIEVVERTSGGGIKTVVVSGTEATVKLNTELCVRKMFGNSEAVLSTKGGEKKMDWLPSAFCIFDIEKNSDVINKLTITGGGYGHGIGMSQNAVRKMAQQRKNYSEILQFFFPGTKLGKIEI